MPEIQRYAICVRLTKGNPYKRVSTKQQKRQHVTCEALSVETISGES